MQHGREPLHPLAFTFGLLARVQQLAFVGAPVAGVEHGAAHDRGPVLVAGRTAAVISTGRRLPSAVAMSTDTSPTEFCMLSSGAMCVS